MRKSWLILLILCVFAAVSARADRDIVYAARYYAPPGSHRTSHFHLYRINPDGTGKTQLTFGYADDENPQWSPDGKHILFTRGAISLCVMDKNGSAMHPLLNWAREEPFAWWHFRWLPMGNAVSAAHRRFIKKLVANRVVSLDDHTDAVYVFDIRNGMKRRIEDVSAYLPCPDEECTYFATDSREFLIETASEVVHPLKNPVTDAVWLDNETLAGLAAGPLDCKSAVLYLGSDGHEKGAVTLTLPAPYTSVYLLATPHPHTMLIYAVKHDNSRDDVDYIFFRFKPATGEATYLTEGQFLAWSPDGSRFCTAPGRIKLGDKKRPYPNAARGDVRTVWNAPLYIRATNSGPMRQLTPRLSWVTGADWRHPPRALPPRNL